MGRIAVREKETPFAGRAHERRSALPFLEAVPTRALARWTLTRLPVAALSPVIHTIRPARLGDRRVVLSRDGPSERDRRLMSLEELGPTYRLGNVHFILVDLGTRLGSHRAH